VKEEPFPLDCADDPPVKEIIAYGENLDPWEWKKGKKYPDRESYALCLCGGSGNKPFCDGSHIVAGFNDGDGSLK
jgi:CDGSH-type Zn-finger protein